MMRTKYAVFDLDGTLLDSMEIWANIGDDILQPFDITPPKDLQEILTPMSIKQSAEYLRETFSLPLSVTQIMDLINKKAEEKYRNEVALKPYVPEYLKKLQSQDIRMGIATANDDCTTREILNRLGILDYFEFIITCTDVDCSKENPKIYYAAAEKFGCDHEEVVVFEDALHCIKTAKQAGFYVVGVGDPSAERDKKEIQKLCDCYIDSFAEMEDF